MLSRCHATSDLTCRYHRSEVSELSLNTTFEIFRGECRASIGSLVHPKRYLRQSSPRRYPNSNGRVWILYNRAGSRSVARAQFPKKHPRRVKSPLNGSASISDLFREEPLYLRNLIFMRGSMPRSAQCLTGGRSLNSAVHSIAKHPSQIAQRVSDEYVFTKESWLVRFVCDHFRSYRDEKSLLVAAQMIKKKGREPRNI